MKNWGTLIVIGLLIWLVMRRPQPAKAAEIPKPGIYPAKPGIYPVY